MSISSMKKNPLSGLLIHYMDSDDEDDNVNEEVNVGKMKNPVSSQNTISNDVDDFLKEINAFSSEVGSETPEAGRTQKPSHISLHHKRAFEGFQSSIPIDTVPTATSCTCSWQECYDEASGYAYYWNMHSNEVTWECPEEYKLYRESLIVQEVSSPAPPTICTINNPKTNDNAQASNSSQSLVRSTEKPTVKMENEGRIIPITSYGDESSEEDPLDATENTAGISNLQMNNEKENVAVASTCHPESSSLNLDPLVECTPSVMQSFVYGPLLPSNDTHSFNCEGDCSSNQPGFAEAASESSQVPSPSSSTNDQDLSLTSPEQSACGLSSSSKPWVLSANAEVSTNSDPEELQEPDSTSARYAKCTLGKENSSTIQSKFYIVEENSKDLSLCSPMPENKEELSPTADESSVVSPRPVWMGKGELNLQYNQDNTGDGKPHRPGFGFGDAILPSLSHNQSSCKLGTGLKTCKSSAITFIRAETLDLKEVNRKQVREYETRAASSKDNDGSLSDIEDIERELDLALERKTNNVSEPDSMRSATAASILSKRNFGQSTEQPSKRVKTTEDSDAQNKVTTSHQMESTEDRSAIEELSATIFDKLDHLGVTVAALSQLQLLLLEARTRINDWRQGALSQGYFLQQLKVADENLSLYKATTVPPDWTCHWDRSRKGYIYVNSVTGQTQSTPPDEMDGGDSPIQVLRNYDTEQLIVPTSSSIVSSTTQKHIPGGAGSKVEEHAPPLPPTVPVPPLPPPPPPSPPPLPPSPPPESPPPPPPDSTEKVECDTVATTAQSLYLQPLSMECMAMPVYSGLPLPVNHLSTPATAYYPSRMPYMMTVDTMQSELDSFYSNLAVGDTDLTPSYLQSAPITNKDSQLPACIVANENQIGSPSGLTAVSGTVSGKRKLKKTKIASGLVLKKKNMPMLVEKWQRIQQEQLTDTEAGPSNSRNTDDVTVSTQKS